MHADRIGLVKMSDMAEWRGCMTVDNFVKTGDSIISKAETRTA